MGKVFSALYISQNESGFSKEIRSLDTDALPEGDVLIRVSHSSLNYKDALSASGNRGVTRKFPHVPGIDAVGEVVTSRVPQFLEGAAVIVTGFDLGMNTWGGFGSYISVPAHWVVPLPLKITAKDAMSLGTAGLTAGLSVDRIIHAGIKPSDGAVVVSGATGGVGSMATAIMSRLGYEVVAVSGKKEDPFLTQIAGASRVIGREEFLDKYDSKPLSAGDFSAGIDNVGGALLSAMLKSVKQNGLVTSCGNVADSALHTTVFPFILRGITLSGIDSASAPLDLRKRVWQKLATSWKPLHLDTMVREIELDQLAEKLEELLAGKARGRYVLKHG